MKKLVLVFIIGSMILNGCGAKEDCPYDAEKIYITDKSTGVRNGAGWPANTFVIHPTEDTYNFTAADALVKFGEENKMAIIGHCLIWHSQLSPWFCVDKDGNNVPSGREDWKFWIRLQIRMCFLNCLNVNLRLLAM